MIAQGLITYPTSVDDPTKVLIFDWFQYREVCDNEKFNSFFNRTLNASMRKYRELLRIQPGEVLDFDGVEQVVTYDWLVQNYREMQHTINEEGMSSETNIGDNNVSRESLSTGTKIGSVVGEDVTDRDTTSTSSSLGEGSSSASSSDQAANASATSHSGEDASDDKTLSKSAPQSISYSGVTGMPTTLDWTYPGAQSEAKHTGSDSSDDTSSASSMGSSASSSANENSGAAAGAGTEDTTFNTSRDTTDADSRVDTSSESGDNSGSRSGVTAHDSIAREISNGRSLDIATLLDNAKNFILGSSAWDYLYGQLDKLFISIYND